MIKLRLAFALICVSLLGACAKDPNDPPLQSLRDIGMLAGIVFAIILTVVVVYRLSGSLGFVGVLIGLILGAATIMSVPLEIQYAIIGGIIGVGGDFATSKSKGKPSTMVESLSGFIVKATIAAYAAASATELETEKRRVSLLLWSAIGTTALMLIVGRILKGVRI